MSIELFQVIDVDLPITVKLKVVEADIGLKGDTAQGDAIFYPANFFLTKFIL
jgi:hypothetical protein